MLAANAEALGIRLDALDAVVLSHGHYDHTGGLSRVLDAAPSVKVFLHPEALAAKYGCGMDGTARFIGIEAGAASFISIRVG